MVPSKMSKIGGSSWSWTKKYLVGMPTEEEKTALLDALKQRIVAARRAAHSDDADSEFKLRCPHDAVHGTVHQAALTGNLFKLRELAYIEASGNSASQNDAVRLLDSQDENGCTPLHLAVMGGHEHILEYLLEAGVDVDCVDRDMTTPLLMCVQRGYVSWVRKLAAAGAATNLPDDAGDLPLLVALRATPEDAILGMVAELITHKLELDCTSSAGVPLVSYAVLRYQRKPSCVPLVKLLLEASANPSQEDKDGRTLVHYAVWSSVEALMALALEFGGKPNWPDAKGRPPLLHAIEGRSKSMVSILAHSGARLDPIKGALARACPNLDLQVQFRTAAQEGEAQYRADVSTMAAVFDSLDFDRKGHISIDQLLLSAPAHLIEKNKDLLTRISHVAGKDAKVAKPPAQWMVDEARQDCSLCRVVYTLTTRRHHCRLCGALVCGACTSHTLILLEHRESRSAPKKVLKARTCDVCFNVARRQERAAAARNAPAEANSGPSDGSRPDQTAGHSIKSGLPLYLAQLAREAGVAQVDREAGRIFIQETAPSQPAKRVFTVDEKFAIHQ